MDDFEVVIGLEVHVQLSTQTKMFCGCRNVFGAEPNTNVCPVCMGYPGVLPVVNKRAVEYAIKTGLALNCKISSFTKFDRKNYYYPDLPKNYQISQYDIPIATEGYLQLKEKKIRIIRVHMEEDAGKLIHDRNKEYSAVDLNRSGVPLLEIVSYPDIRSAQEAVEYLKKLKLILEYIEVSDCNMQEGSLRCDANLSVRKKGEKELGVKTEIKNMNSFKAIEQALEYEAKRQISLLKDGEKIIQETRLWDENALITRSMRSKEESHDYRYFPEPDLPPIYISKEWVEKIKEELPLLPEERKEKFIKEYNIPEYDANILTSEKAIADFYEKAVNLKPDWTKEISNWIMGEPLRYINEHNILFKEVNLSPEDLIWIIKSVKEEKINQNTGKEVLWEVMQTGKSPQKIVEDKGLMQISDEESLKSIIKQVVSENPKAIQDYKKGKKQVIGFLIGQVMRKTKGKANHKVVQKLLLESLS